MRISSSTIFTNNVALLNQQQSQLASTQQQIASGIQLTNAAVDPVAYTQALSVTQSVASLISSLPAVPLRSMLCRLKKALCRV